MIYNFLSVEQGARKCVSNLDPCYLAGLELQLQVYVTVRKDESYKAAQHTTSSVMTENSYNIFHPEKIRIELSMFELPIAGYHLEK
jgi:hypothetical protein